MDKQQVIADLTDKIESGRLKLPGLPELAVKIRQATNDPEKDISDISKIIQSDPLVTAYLIKTVNSPIYRGHKPISSCREAIMRLGLKVTRNLVVAYTMRRFFQPKTGRFKSRMHNLWQHSTQVAALASVLARNSGSSLNPDKALLAGLLHDLGTIPLLQMLVDAQLTDQELDQTIASLRGKIGQKMLESWKLDTELADACIGSGNWMRDETAQLDYTDLVNIAELLSFIGQPEMSNFPPLHQVPAMARFGIADPSLETSMIILDQAKQDIAEVEQLLRG